MRYTGKLSNYNADRGFGFVNLPNFEKGVFIHFTHIEGELETGDELEFDVVVVDGKPQGRNVTKVAHGWDKVTAQLPLRPKSIVVPATPPAIPQQEVKPVEKPDNTLTFERKNLGEPRRDRALHLYMPWNPVYIKNQMFELRDRVDKYNHTWIPKISSTKNKIAFDMTIVDVLENQVKHGIETCLYMTNFNCIHIWKIEGFHRKTMLPATEKEKTLPDYDAYEAEFWIQVSDVYVLQADHDGKLTPILQELEKLSLCHDFETLAYNNQAKITPYMSAQRYPAPVTRNDNVIFFPGVSMETFVGQDRVDTRKTKWLNTHRKVTKEYNLMNEHMSKNVYPDMWVKFNERTRHFLIEFEMLKIESAGYNSLQALQFSKQKFECYISALINELDEVVGSRLIMACERLKIPRIPYEKPEYNCLSVIKGHAPNVPDLNFYKSLLTDPLWKGEMDRLFKEHKGENMLVLGDILSLTQFESIISKLEALVRLRNWFAHDYFYVVSKVRETGNRGEESKLLTDINNILNLVTTPFSNNNIFMDLYVYKTKKKHIVQTADFRDLVAELRSAFKKAA